jgi:hypothetical protein
MEHDQLPMRAAALELAGILTGMKGELANRMTPC